MSETPMKFVVTDEALLRELWRVAKHFGWWGWWQSGPATLEEFREKDPIGYEELYDEVHHMLSHAGEPIQELSQKEK